MLDPGESCDQGIFNSDTEPGRCRTDCQPARCGDGVVDTAEACEPGLPLTATCETMGFVAGELTCTESCLVGTAGCHECGNGVIDGAEECDGANLGGATCVDLGYGSGDLVCEDCFLADSLCSWCGNGVVDPGEVCDDGNAQDDLACAADCLHFCGDGAVDSVLGEQCDLGADNGSPGSVCTDTCEDNQCGDGHLGPEEACDDGTANSDTLPDACRTDCRLPHCGDGVADTPEACDGVDHSGLDCTDFGYVAPGGLACDGACEPDSTACGAACGNGVAEPGELCDGGDLGGLDCTDFGFVVPGGLACDGACQPASSLCGAVCGNGVLEPGEQCDDGNTSSGDACRDDCGQDLTLCGSTTLDPGEQCDLGGANSDAPDATCRLDCQSRRCGDAIVDPGAAEQCDTGVSNSSAPDATCRPDCQPQRCGDAIVDPGAGEQCDLGGANSDAPDATCRPDCQPRRCGDGISDPGAGEQCDGADLAGASCNDYGFGDPSGLQCSTTCAPDPSGCAPTCNNGMLEAGELCDGAELGSVTCVEFGFSNPAGLACGASCTSYDPAGCTGSCGNSTREPDEACDDGNTADGDGCSSGCAVETNWECTGAVGEVSSCTCTGQLLGGVCQLCIVFVTPTGAGARDGSSWSDAFGDLQAGVNAAAAQAAPGAPCEVWLAEGRYHIHDTAVTDTLTMASHIRLYGGFSGSATSRDERDPTLHPSEIDGRAPAGYPRVRHVVTMPTSTVDLILDSVTIQQGEARGPSTFDRRGAGLLIGDNVELTLRHVTVRDNSSDHYLGTSAGLAAGDNCNLTIEDSQFLYNRAAWLAMGVQSIGGSLTLRRTRFEGNVNVEPYEPSMTLIDLSVLVEDCVFRNNHGGSALRIWGGDITVRRSWMEDTGGIHVEDGAWAQVANSVFRGTAGISAESMSNVDVVHCTFVDPGSWNRWVSTEGTTSVRNSILLHHSGAGLYNDNGTFEIRDSLVGNLPVANVQMLNLQVNPDPQFVDPGAGDYGLQPSSPCIDHGPSEPGLAVDLAGQPRSVDDPSVTDQAGPADCGALERQPLCGNGFVDPGERCDGPALDGATCVDFGYSAPNGLACRVDCQALVTTGCAPTCGNGVPEPPETCDDGNVAGGDGCSSTCTLEPLPCVRYVSVGGGAAPPTDGLSWSTALATVQEGVDAAALAASPDHPCQVWLAAGDYDVSGGSDLDSLYTRSHVHVLGGFLVGDANVGDRDWQTNVTRIRGTVPGESYSVEHLVQVNPGTEDFVFDGVRLSGGSAWEYSGTRSQVGGTLYALGPAEITVRNGTMNGSAWDGGAALYATHGTHITVEDTLVSGCYSYDGTFSLNRGSSLVARRTEFDGNRANTKGNAVFLSDSTALLEDCLMIDGLDSAAVSVERSSLVMRRCRFEDNHADLTLASSVAEIDNCLFSEADMNIAMYVWNDTAVTFRHCTWVYDACTSTSNAAFYVSSGSAVSIQSSILQCLAAGDMLPNDAGISVDHSLVIPAPQAAVTVTNLISGSPLFLDQSARDYRLTTSSPCVDAAPHLPGITLDVAGDPMPVDDPAVTNTGAGGTDYADCGAHERQP